MAGSIDRKKSQKGSLKEKVLQVYDKLFQGQDIAQGRAEFWDDFFLLKVNVKCLISHFEKSQSEELLLLKPLLNRLLLQCLHTAQFEKHRIRVANAIQTMDAMITGVYRCKSATDPEADASDLLLNEQQAKEFMQRYTTLCSDMFREDRPERLRALILNSMRTFATASSNFRRNPFAVGLMDAKILDLLRLTLVNAHLRYHHGMAACELLGLLTQFAKHQVGEWSKQQFCLTDDDLLLNGVSSTISLALSEFNLRFRQQHDPSVGFLSSMSSFFGSLFVGDMASNVSLRPCDSLLMGMYAITKDSAHFSTILSYSNAHCATDTRGFDTLSAAGSLRDEKLLRAFSTDSMVGFSMVNNPLAPGRAVPADEVGDSSARRTTQSVDDSALESMDISRISTQSTRLSYDVSDSHDSVDPTILSVPINGCSGDNLSAPDESNEAATTATLEPRNLLADLLEYCSIVMQDVKTPESLNSCHLCLIIVLCITQNPMACSILHDPHITFKVWIHKQRSRYRKSPPNSCANFSSRPIAIAILSLIVEFVRGHLMKKLPHRLYRISLSICHNLLCYQIKHKIRLDFDWKQLWCALLSLLQFVLNLESSALPLTVGFGLMQKILEIFNLCILQGDSFLQAADVYDNLYYELIRMHNLIENLHEHALLHSKDTDPDLKAAASNVVLQMGNIRSIVNHFNAKIAAFTAANSLASLTESQVLAVVRENYDSLTLRVLENLDVPDLYAESDDDLLFDTLVDTVLRQTRKDCLETSLEMQSYFHELSAIY